jgi:glutathione S-transferase
VLVDDGRAISDSTAIARWLDVAYPDTPRLWPAEDAHVTLEVATLVDATLDLLIDLGTRYYALRDSPAWSEVKDELLGRARSAAAGLAQHVTALGRPTISRAGWSGADMSLFTMVLWFEAWPSRAATSPNIAQLMTLGFELPTPLARWADAHRSRPDVAAL